MRKGFHLCTSVSPHCVAVMRVAGLCTLECLLLSGANGAPAFATLRADYTIRMNFTTVPRTWERVVKWTHGIPVHYKVTTAGEK